MFQWWPRSPFTFIIHKKMEVNGDWGGSTLKFCLLWFINNMRVNKWHFLVSCPFTFLVWMCMLFQNVGLCYLSSNRGVKTRPSPLASETTYFLDWHHQCLNKSCTAHISPSKHSVLPYVIFLFYITKKMWSVWLAFSCNKREKYFIKQNSNWLHRRTVKRNSPCLLSRTLIARLRVNSIIEGLV